MRRIDCHVRIKRVRSNYQAALQTVTTLIHLVEQRPEYLYDFNLDLVEMRAVSVQLHDIYFARMFASFESSLRHYCTGGRASGIPSL
jgi:hypothetical protein